MPFVTYRLGSGNDGNFAALFETNQTQVSRTDGWTVAKIAAGNSCEFDAGTKQLSTAFTSQTTTPKPASFLTGTTANAFKTASAITGTFSNQLWGLLVTVIATTSSSQAGRGRWRVFKSVNANGTSATELSSSTLVGDTTGTILTGAEQVSIANWSPGALTLTNEFLFFVVAWEITTASGSNSGDVVLRTGYGDGVGTCVQAPNFTAGSAVVPKPRLLRAPGVAVFRAATR